MESSLFGFAGALPPYAMSAVMVGEGVAFVGSTAAQLLVKWSLPGRPAAAAGFYAAVAAAIMAGCGAAGLWLRRNGAVIAAGADQRKNPFVMFAAAASAASGSHPATSTAIAAAESLGASGARPQVLVAATAAEPPAAGGGLLAADAAESGSVGVDLRPVASLETVTGVATGSGPHSPQATKTDDPADAGSGSSSSSGSTATTAADSPPDPAPPAWLLAYAGKADSAGTVARWLIAMLRVLRQMWPAACAIALSFICTFLVFPGASSGAAAVACCLLTRTYSLVCALRLPAHHCAACSDSFAT